MIIDKGSIDFTSKLEESTGFLKLKANFARCGIYEYLGVELGLEDSDAEKVFKVLRHPDDVFNKESIATYLTAPVTDKHPSTFVDINNVKALQKGQISHAVQNGEYLEGNVTITDKTLIDSILSGMIEISPGYLAKTHKESGVYQGETYDYRMTDIRINHIAVVGKARGGQKCKLKDEKGQLSMAIIKIQDVDFEVSEQAKQAFQAAQSAMLTELTKSKDEIGTLSTKLKDATANVEKQKGEIDALTKAKLSNEDLTQLIKTRTALIDQAKKFVDKETDLSELSDMDIKRQVVLSVYKDTTSEELKAKTDEYTQGMYDVAIKDQGKPADANQEALKALGEKMTKSKGTADLSSRDKWMKDHLKIKHIGA